MSTHSTAKARPLTEQIPSQRGFFQRALIAEAMWEHKIPHGAQLLYQELTRSCGKRLYTWVKQGELAAKLRVSRRTISRYERQLIGAGLLTTVRASLTRAWKAGSVRRVAIPHTLHGESLRAPEGVLTDNGYLEPAELFAIDAKIKQHPRFRRLPSIATLVSHLSASLPSIGITRVKTPDRAKSPRRTKARTWGEHEKLPTPPTFGVHFDQMLAGMTT